MKKMGKPKITLEVEGIEELGKLIEILYKQIGELKETVANINLVSFNIQAKINQPPERSDG